MIDGGGEHVGAHHHAGAAARRRVIDGAMAAEAELANGHRAQRPQARFQRADRRARCQAARETFPGTASAPLPARADAHLCIGKNAAFPCRCRPLISGERRAARRAVCRSPLLDALDDDHVQRAGALAQPSWPRRTRASWHSRAPSRSCRTRCTTLRASPSPSTISAWPPPHNAACPPNFSSATFDLVTYSAHFSGLVTSARTITYPLGMGLTPPVVSISRPWRAARLRFADVVDKGFSDHLGIVGLRDRAPDDDVVGAGRDGVAGRRDALLVVGGAAGEADAGRDDEEAGPTASRMRAASWPEAMTPSKPDSRASFARRSTRSAGLSDEPCCRRSSAVRLVSTVTASSFSVLEPRPVTAARMVLRSWPWTVRKSTPKLGRVGNRPLDRVADVEQLHVEEDVLAVALESAGQVEAAGEQQFQADLVERDRARRARATSRCASSTVGMSRATIRRSLAVGEVMTGSALEGAGRYPCSTCAARASFWISALKCLLLSLFLRCPSSP